MKSIFFISFFYVLLLLSVNSLSAELVLHDPMIPINFIQNHSSLNLIDANSQQIISLEKERIDIQSISVLVLGKYQSFVVMDDVVLKPGDYFKKWKVLSISSQGVFLTNQSLTQEVSTNPLVLKTFPTQDIKGKAYDAQGYQIPRKNP